jgi:hypothetical protein
MLRIIPKIKEIVYPYAKEELMEKKHIRFLTDGIRGKIENMEDAFYKGDKRYLDNASDDAYYYLQELKDTLKMIIGDF